MRAGDNGMTKDEQAGMTSYIEGGKGFVCIHISGSASEDWFEYYNITGGGWVPGQSYHPPYGKFTVNVKNASHAGVQGISDFETNDEFYLGDLEYKDDGGNDARRAIQLLRQVVGDDADAPALLRAAMATEAPRIVVKRPLRAVPLGGRPSHSRIGKLVRYDVYQRSPQRSPATG